MANGSGTNGNGDGNDGSNIVAAIERLRGDMMTGFANQIATGERTNERIDALATGNVNGFARLETRLDEIAKTGERYRELADRVARLETRVDEIRARP